METPEKMLKVSVYHPKMPVSDRENIIFEISKKMFELAKEHFENQDLGNFYDCNLCPPKR
ncbi:hypothetical protein FACS1894132_09850 [Clostridia bacterium]|nr:hypothetical protein FACS1894132_09850 [Clostridia bacterium]